MDNLQVPLKKETYPLLADRIQSTFIDMVLIIVLMFVFASVLDRYENVPDWIRIALFFFLFGIYEPVCTTAGCTLGNYSKKIRVRRVTDTGKRITIFQALIRYVFKVLLGWLSFLTIHSNPGKRAIHDLAAGSVMIKID